MQESKLVPVARTTPEGLVSDSEHKMLNPSARDLAHVAKLTKFRMKAQMAKIDRGLAHIANSVCQWFGNSSINEHK